MKCFFKTGFLNLVYFELHSYTEKNILYKILITLKGNWLCTNFPLYIIEVIFKLGIFSVSLCTDNNNSDCKFVFIVKYCILFNKGNFIFSIKIK